MKCYKGDIIEESLENKTVLSKVKILSTRVEEVTEEHRTPWLKQWKLHTVEVGVDKAHEIAREISKSLDTKHKGSWYADFKNETNHYIIFPNKIFFIDRESKKQYQEASDYGISLGIPEYQVNFLTSVKN